MAALTKPPTHASLALTLNAPWKPRVSTLRGSADAAPHSLRPLSLQVPAQVPHSSLPRQRRDLSCSLRAASGEGGAAAAAEAKACPPLAGAALVPFVDPQTGAPTAFPAASGIYAIHDSEGTLQYMGVARRLNASLAVHLRELPELCSAVKFAEVTSPERAALIAAWQQWIEEHVEATGKPPPGNESGNTTWTTRRRPAKPEIRLTPGGNKELSCSMEELIGKVVKEFKVVVFVKGTRTEPQCGFSHRVLNIMNESGADFEVLNVLDEDHNPGLREAIKQYSQWPTIPQIFIGGEFVGGADVLTEMAESGELKEALAKAQVTAKAAA